MLFRSAMPAGELREKLAEGSDDVEGWVPISAADEFLVGERSDVTPPLAVRPLDLRLADIVTWTEEEHQNERRRITRRRKD